MGYFKSNKLQYQSFVLFLNLAVFRIFVQIKKSEFFLHFIMVGASSFIILDSSAMAIPKPQKVGASRFEIIKCL